MVLGFARRETRLSRGRSRSRRHRCPRSRIHHSNSFANLLGQPAFTNWTQAGAAKLRTQVGEAMRKDRLVIYGSQFHLEEASRIPDDRGLRTRCIRYFWDHVKWNLILPTKEVGILEAGHRRRLEGTESFDEWRRREIRFMTKDSAGFAASRAMSRPTSITRSSTSPHGATRRGRQSRRGTRTSPRTRRRSGGGQC
jgi:hypothetical protein